MPRIPAEALRVVREPLRLAIGAGVRADPAAVLALIRTAARGPALDAWPVPRWLLPHQREAARRMAGALRAFGGGLLADAAGTGKTYVALAVATRYRRPALTAPASLISQWRRTAQSLNVPLQAVSHEALSRGAPLPPADLVIVDEAHRLRNTATHRHDVLARGLRGADLLLVSATPVVNRSDDLAALLRLFLPDHGLAALGVGSLERACGEASSARLLSASLPLTVARPLESLDQAGARAVPHVDDERVARTPSAPSTVFDRLLEGIEGLEFPGFGDRRARALLRLHLVHRLSSSTAAFRQSVKRHLAYLDRAQSRAADGEPLTRAAARRLFGPNDELQLELGYLLPVQGDEAPGSSVFERERQRLLGLLDVLRARPLPNPKAQQLLALLRRRRNRRTIVFTAAESTAVDLARRLGWRHVAVVASGRARVASGRIAVERALALFAPHARGAPHPAATLNVETLIATDLVSEGLDLQDADAIVHYDLPWTPQRLTQRLGRIARLGSRNRRATVFWFLPPVAVEHGLRLSERLGTKATRQLSLPVPSTSMVGKARVANRSLNTRARLARDVCRSEAKPTDHRYRFAVVRGPPAVVAAVVWTLGDVEIPQIVVIAGAPAVEVPDVAMQNRLLQRLEGGDSIEGVPPQSLLRALLEILRGRLWATALGPTDTWSRRLRRSVLRAAWDAGKQHDARRVDRLDAVLDRLQRGTCSGAALDLADVLRTSMDGDALDRWLRTWPIRRGAPATVRLTALLFGWRTRP